MTRRETGGSRRGRRDDDHDGARDHDDGQDEGPIEIAIVGDLTDNEADLTDRLLGVEPGGACTIYFDSPGGSPYCAMSLTALCLLYTSPSPRD